MEDSSSSNRVEIRVDYRERDLYERLADMLGVLADVVIRPCNLLMGDVVIGRGAEHGGYVTIERKTVADLSSSITDGRYHEQKTRMLANVGRGRMVYVVEGAVPSAPTHFMNETKLQSIHSAILHATFRDRIVVYRTMDVADTATFIVQLWKRISKDPVVWDEYFQRGSGVVDLEPTADPALYMRKCANNTPEFVFLNMLAQVSGCSTRIASAVAKEYGTMYGLIQAYQATPEATRPDLLANVMVEKRRLGKVLSRRIYECLFGVKTT